MSKKSILIVCEAGISASLLVLKMTESIREDALDYEVDYAPVLRLDEKMANKSFDIILLTPQVIRHEARIQELIDENKNKSKMIFIDEDDFKYMNIPNILGLLD